MTHTEQACGSDAGRGFNIHTFSGNQFFPMAPAEEDVFIGDIAHALSVITRFGGHCRWFYSVAQHSVLASLNVPLEHAFEALMHDAAEAYIGDMVRPLKPHNPDFVAIDARLDAVIRSRFGLPEQMSQTVKEIDVVMCATEKRDLLWPSRADWGNLPDPLPVRIEPWPQEYAKFRFLKRFGQLYVGD